MDVDEVNSIVPEMNSELESDFAFSVSVSVEPNPECEIQEIKYDNEEIYKEPMSQSDNLAMMISKIEFNEELGLTYSDEAFNKYKDSFKNANKQAKKFHRNIFDKIKQSYDEVCVLLDCLNIAFTEPGLISLENCHDEEKNTDNTKESVKEKLLSVTLKKKNIDSAKMLLKMSFEKILADHEYNNNRFHSELYRMRQFWRIRKAGNKFLGDFSFRTAGCRNAIRGSFEVLKNDVNRERQVDVLIAEEFEEESFITVQLISSGSDVKPFLHLKCSLFQTNRRCNEPHWQQELDFAQNSLYAKELFSQILREAYELQPTLKPLVIGNTVKLMITHDIELIISLIHSTSESQANFNNFEFKKYDFDSCLLEYSLSHLLRKLFAQNFQHQEMRPVTSMVAYNYYVKLAGMTHARELKYKQISLLQSIKEISEHLILKKRIYKILTEIARYVREPVMTVDQLYGSTSTSTEYRIKIFSTNYELFASASYVVRIKNMNVTVLSQSNRIRFDEHINGLRAYFLDQCTIHQMNCIQQISHTFDWITLSNSIIENRDYQVPVLLLWNNSFYKTVAIKIGPVNKMELYVNNNKIDGQKSVQNVNVEDVNEVDLAKAVKITNIDWLRVENDFLNVDIDSYPGRSLVNKYELFLADIAII